MLLTSILLLNAIDITVKPEKNYETTPNEIELLKASMIQQRIMISPEQAKNLISENRYLCEEYLKNNTIPENILINFKLELEKHIASYVIEDIQKKIIIDDDTIRSYYVSHTNEFIESEQITLSLYRFENFDNALDFYSKYKSNIHGIEKYSKEHNISVRVQEVSSKQIDPYLRNMINHARENPPYLMPPQFFYDHYSILHVSDKKKESVKPYDNVKKEIEDLLHKKALQRQKNELLKPYRQITKKQ